MPGTGATILPNGTPSVRLTLPTLGAIASILSLVSFLAGGYFGYTEFKSDVINLAKSTAGIQNRLELLQAELVTANKDRELLANRLTGVERDIDYIKQGIAELKLRTATGR